jgi:hypothetical protein
MAGGEGFMTLCAFLFSILMADDSIFNRYAEEERQPA